MAIRAMSRMFASSVKDTNLLKARLKKEYFELFAATDIEANNITALRIHPTMLRFAFHDAGTFDKSDQTGGSHASIRFDSELGRPENRTLDGIKSLVDKIKQKFPEVSYADLIQFGGIAAVQFKEGPEIDFRFGRVDAINESQCPPINRIPDPTRGLEHLRAIFGRMGLTDEDIVALSGAHTLGRVHSHDKPWTPNESVFDNSYFQKLRGLESPSLIRLPTDLALLSDPKMAELVNLFADDKAAFFDSYKKSHKKMSELGFP